MAASWRAGANAAAAFFQVVAITQPLSKSQFFFKYKCGRGFGSFFFLGLWWLSPAKKKGVAGLPAPIFFCAGCTAPRLFLGRFASLAFARVKIISRSFGLKRPHSSLKGKGAAGGSFPPPPPWICKIHLYGGGLPPQFKIQIRGKSQTARRLHLRIPPVGRAPHFLFMIFLGTKKITNKKPFSAVPCLAFCRNTKMQYRYEIQKSQTAHRLHLRIPPVGRAPHFLFMIFLGTKKITNKKTFSAVPCLAFF